MRSERDRPATTGSGMDGVRVAILTHRFEAIVRSMMNTLVRTGRSGVLNTGQDFSCCVFTAEHELLQVAESQPVHVLTGDLMTRAMTQFHPRLRRGDAFLHNSPYHGSTHAADHTILIPVIDDDGVHRLTVLAKAHQADCGNAEPTTYSAEARDVYEEGALIFPCVRIQQDHQDIEDIIRVCKLRIRVPEQWWGDYLALLGSARVGEQRLLELGAEIGWDAVEDYARAWFDYSEGRMIAAIRGLPSGRVTGTSTHDPFPGVPNGVPVRATVDVRSEDAIVEVDLRDNIDAVPCGLNLTEATATAGAMMGVFNSLHQDVPTNAGSFRRLRIHLREGCVVGIPRHPTSCSVATTNVADRVANSIHKAMATLGDGVGMAESGPTQPPAWGVISGVDPRSGAPFINQIMFAAVTCGGASPVADGYLLLAGVGDAGMLWRDSVELDELRFPLLVQSQTLLADTEGAGRQRGAPAAYVEYGPIGSALEVMYASDGTIHNPEGVRGGMAGSPAQQYRRGTSGQLVELPNCARVVLETGETIISYCCAGGGYGDPLTREPESVAEDVLEGYVSRARAESVYGVVLDDAGEADKARTSELRAELRRGRAEKVPDGRIG
jgi:N-methylhydantoinase B/oxoprolinase/acetone carboxylase alpha subunit